MSATYLDSSALVKLVVREAESAALRRYLRGRQPLISSALCRTEVVRAVLAEGNDAIKRAGMVFDRIEQVRVGDRILNRAALLLPQSVRSLDAIHLATAQELGADLSLIVSYDDRLNNTAETLGLKTVRPT